MAGEEWSLVTALYFATVTLTTVGYGDQPDWSGDGIRVFTAFYALFGIILIGAALGVVGSQVMEANERSMVKAKKLALDSSNRGKVSERSSDERPSAKHKTSLIVAPLLVVCSALFINRRFAPCRSSSAVC